MNRRVFFSTTILFLYSKTSMGTRGHKIGYTRRLKETRQEAIKYGTYSWRQIKNALGYIPLGRKKKHFVQNPGPAPRKKGGLRQVSGLLAPAYNAGVNTSHPMPRTMTQKCRAPVIIQFFYHTTYYPPSALLGYGTDRWETSTRCRWCLR